MDGAQHKSLETTMRYLVLATEVHRRLDEVKIPGLGKPSTTLARSTRTTASGVHTSSIVRCKRAAE